MKPPLDKRISPEDRAIADAKLSTWSDLAKSDSRRIGMKWVIPAEALRLHLESDDLIRKALEFLRLNNRDLAKQYLERASKADPSATDADFIMGLIYAVISKDLEKADIHFQECLKRDRNNVRILNNLALIQIKQKQFAPGLNFLRSAILIAPGTPYLSQNLGRLIDQAGRRRLSVPAATTAEAAKLYELILDFGGKPSESDIGWLFMLPDRLSSKGLEDRVENVKSNKPSSLQVDGGCALVVGSGYLVTTANIVRDSSDLSVVLKDATERERIAIASVVAKSPDGELVLLKCPDVGDQQVTFNSSAGTRGDRVGIIGYPSLLGHQLKAASTQAILLSSAATDRLLVEYQNTSPLVGGPVCDTFGNVIGLHVENLPSKNRAAAIGAQAIVELLKANVPDFEMTEPLTRTAAWSAVDSRMQPATVLVFRQEWLMNPADIGLRTTNVRYIEDTTCMFCMGRKSVDCPVSSCARGSVRVRVARTITDANGNSSTIFVPTPSRCDTCGGEGLVPCSICGGSGEDRDLSR